MKTFKLMPLILTLLFFTVPAQAKEVKEAVPGKIGVYKLVEINGKRYCDLGFSIYSEISEGSPLDVQESANPNPPEEDLHTYRAHVTKVYDGDTFHALIDLGFGTVLDQRLRLRRLDAPELSEDEGEEAKAALEKALGVSETDVFAEILLKVSKHDDQYGRYLADVWVNEKDIHQQLLDSGFFTVRE